MAIAEALFTVLELEKKKRFDQEFNQLPIDVQNTLKHLIYEIHEVGLVHIGGCPWRGPRDQFELARPVLQIISPSINGEENERGTFCATWNTNDFVVPDMFKLDEVISPLSAGEPGQLCRSTSGDDWCVTPSSAYADDDCPSSYGIPNTRRHQPVIITGRDIDQAIRIEALAAAKSTGKDCPSSAYAEDETPMYADDDCPSSSGGWR